MTDPIADMLARIKNACLRNYQTVDVPTSKIKVGILSVLEREGYIIGFDNIEKDGHPYVRVKLKYHDGKPVIQILERVSKSSGRVYSKINKIPRVFNGFGIYVISTSKGILSDAEAREQNVGGEILCKVF